MGRMVQIRNVPEEIHRTLKARAALAGMSLSDYLLDEIRRFAQRPTRDELIEHLANLPPVRTRISPAAAVRAERSRRDRR
jgi:antitoxin FitA